MPTSAVREFLAVRRADVAAAWLAAASHLPHAPLVGPARLAEHVPPLLDRIAARLAAERAADARVGETARRHAEERFARGVPLSGLLEEYRLLRRTILRLLLEHEGAAGRQAGECVVLLDSALDDALADAVTRYVELREQPLALVEERLRLALDCAGMGTWDLDVASGTFAFDDRCAALLGLDRGARVTFGGFLALVHPEDRAEVEARSRAALAGAGGGAFRAEHRVVRPSDAAVRWVAVRGSALFDGRARAVRFAGTVVDVTEAKAAEETRERFLGILGHDLRTPLQTIALSATQLGRSGELSRRTEGAVDRIARASHRMNRMVRDLLDLARGRRGGLVVNPTPSDLTVICRSVVEEVRTLHPGRAIALVTAGELRGTWDRDRIAQAVTNLLVNAVTHGADPVGVEARGSGDWVEVVVSNGGRPIAPEERPLLFEPFRRGRTARSQAHGLGLGLYIVAEIMRAHGGSVDVRSDPVATAFTLRFPRHAPSRTGAAR